MRAARSPLPEHLLRWTDADGVLVPSYLTARDQPWLRELVQELEAVAGRRLLELRARWRRRPHDPRAGARAALAQHVLLRSCSGPLRTVVAPGVARAAVFGPAAGDRAAAIAAAGSRLGVTPAAVEAALFADVASERIVVAPAAPLDPATLALQVNLLLAQGFARLATAAVLRFCGASRTVLRTALLLGAPLALVPGSGADARLRWQAADPATGRRQARALAALLPLLPWCRRFELRARVCVQGRTGTFVLGSGDPILPGPPPRGEASALERAFVRDCARAGDAWTVVHEPAPVQLGEAVVFPDFALQQRHSGRAVLVEIAGFWPAEYLARKLQLLAAVPQLLLCVPARRAAGLPPHPRLLPFARRVDVAVVLAAATALLPA